jgi:hypothetical protein
VPVSAFHYVTRRFCMEKKKKRWDEWEKEH